MSRLIDADKIYSDLINIKENTKATGNEVIFSLNDVITILNGSPTAYNVDKVIEELEERSKKYNSGVRLHGKLEEMLTYEAIEIVRKGGVE